MTMATIESHRAAAMIVRELREPLVAAGARHVRTPEGAAKYGQPIGSVIKKDFAPRAKRMKARVAKAEEVALRGIRTGRFSRDEYGKGPEHPYFGFKRIADGRVILPETMLSDLAENGPHSIEKHLERVKDADGNEVRVLSKEREALHVEMVQKSLDGIKPNPKGKNAFFTGGGFGAGKGTATRLVEGYPRVRELKEYDSKPPGEAVIIDPDGIKERLPEWGQPDMARTGSFAHEESSIVSKRLYDATMRLNLDLVLDGTGNNSMKSIGGKVAKARDAGYRTTSVYVTVPSEEAVIRTISRALGNGRFIDPTMTTMAHAKVSRLLDQVGTLYDDYNLYDADVPLGTPPNAIVEHGKVVDPEMFQRALDKRDDTGPKVIERALALARTRNFDGIPKAFTTGKSMDAEEVRAFVIDYLLRTQKALQPK